MRFEEIIVEGYHSLLKKLAERVRWLKMEEVEKMRWQEKIEKWIFKLVICAVVDGC